MIDLTNRTEEELTALIEKHKLPLEMVEDQTKLALFAYIIDATVKYLTFDGSLEGTSTPCLWGQKFSPAKKWEEWKAWEAWEEQKGSSKSWKALCVLTMVKMYMQYDDKIQLHMLIDQFNEYTLNEYQNYLSDIAMYASDYDRDHRFINKFISFYESKYGLKTK